MRLLACRILVVALVYYQQVAEAFALSHVQWEGNLVLTLFLGAMSPRLQMDTTQDSQ